MNLEYCTETIGQTFSAHTDCIWSFLFSSICVPVYILKIITRLLTPFNVTMPQSDLHKAYSAKTQLETLIFFMTVHTVTKPQKRHGFVKAYTYFKSQ